jgi:pimeloyl-ACP methyl ester carboxylesterase
VDRHASPPSGLRKVLFLPGAGGSPEFWRPVATSLPQAWDKVLLGWPGLGDQPHDPEINSIDDLVRRVELMIDGPVDLVAQSMGGVIAARIALGRPEAVRRLVLVATSAGVNMAQFGASDWRANYRRQYPGAAAWITHRSAAAELAVERIAAPSLLIWGDCDPISPVAVGRALEHRMPDARLHIVSGGDHSLAVEHAEPVAALIAQHLQ